MPFICITAHIYGRFPLKPAILRIFLFETRGLKRIADALTGAAIGGGISEGKRRSVGKDIKDLVANQKPSHMQAQPSLSCMNGNKRKFLHRPNNLA